MKKDKFLESLQLQATGNHQRNLILGNKQKTTQQRLDEINLGGSNSDQDYYYDYNLNDNQIIELKSKEDLPNLATLQQGAHGGLVEKRNISESLRNIRQKIGLENETAGDTPAYFRQEMEKIHEELVGLLGRIKVLINQM